MSSRGSLFLTSKGDHWYEDFSTLSPSSTPERQIPNIHISIGKDDVISMKYDEIKETWFFEIDGDSELAKAISQCRK